MEAAVLVQEVGVPSYSLEITLILILKPVFKKEKAMYTGFKRHKKFEFWLADYRAIRKKRKITTPEPNEFVLREC